MPSNFGKPVRREHRLKIRKVEGAATFDALADTLREGCMKTILALLLGFILGTAPAWAVLGEHEGSVGSDQQYLRGQIRAVARDGYSLQQITAKDGALVNEYVSPVGLVFGVSWQGPTMPNLQQLLGSYFAQFQQAAPSRARRRGPLVVRTDQLVLESGGHMRSFHGRAYVPGLLPDNISAEVMR